MCSVFVNHLKRTRNTNDRFIDEIVLYLKKNIKLQPVPPSVELEALLIPDNLTFNDSDGMTEAQVVILIVLHSKRLNIQEISNFWVYS